MVAYQLIPNANDQRNVSQGDLKNNFTYLQTSVGVDHSFTNNTATSQDGYHKTVHLVPASTPANNAGAGQLYSKTGTTGNALHFMPSTGSEVQLSLYPIRACCKFTTAGLVASTGFGITSVTKTVTGKYTVAFSTNMPSTGYNIQLSIQSDTSARPMAQVASGTITTSGFQVWIFNQSVFTDSFDNIFILIVGG